MPEEQEPLGDEEYIPKLVHLPGTRLTPEVVLHRTLNKLKHIKAVSVIVQWDDGTFDTDWSQMPVTELLTGAALLQHHAMSVLIGNPIPDAVIIPPKEPS